MLTYTLPNRTDPEGNTTKIVFTSVLPGFTLFNNDSTFIFTPLEEESPSNVSIEFIVFDGAMNTSYNFTLFVLHPPILSLGLLGLVAALSNTGPPVFDLPLHKSIDMYFDEYLEYNLPSISDPDGDSFDIVLKYGDAQPFVSGNGKTL